jgi:glycosyltransferase involved in cell wall biosynthesis
MDARPVVSIVVPTRNSEKTLNICLNATRNQTYKNIELIIADEFSNDRTVEIARKYTDRVYITEAKERSAQKNRGFQKASGEFVCFIDSDMELTPSVIEECLECMNEQEGIGGVIIPERSIGDSFWVEVRDFERSFYAGSVVESARFFRSDLVKQVGGYDEDTVFFEESVLPQKIEKLGYSVTARITSEIVHHEHGFSLWRHLLKRYYYGKTTSTYREKSRNYFEKQYGLGYRIKLFFANDRFWQRPVLALSVLTLKMLELGFNELGAFSSRIARNGHPR